MSKQLTKKTSQPVKKQGQIITARRIQVSSGPLPSPQILEHYNQILPGAAERIFNMAELAQKNEYHQNNKNLNLGFFVYTIAALTSLSVIGLAAYALYLNKPLAAGIIGALVTMVLAILGYRAVVKK